MESAYKLLLFIKQTRMGQNEKISSRLVWQYTKATLVYQNSQ